MCELLQIKHLCVAIYTGLHWTSYFTRQARATHIYSQTFSGFLLLTQWLMLYEGCTKYTATILVHESMRSS